MAKPRTLNIKAPCCKKASQLKHCIMKARNS